MASDQIEEKMLKPRVTEIKVRMDCNGCVQKIKKALHAVPGIDDIYVDFSEQKVSITGYAEPEKLVKAIRKTRKSAVICIHTEQSDQAEPPPEGETTPEQEGAPSPPETPPDPTNPRAEPSTTDAEPPDEPPQPENPTPATSQTHQHPKPSDTDGVHIVYHHPPDHEYQHPYGPNHQQGYNEPRNAYHVGPGFRGEPHQPPQPVYANTYRPSPHVTQYSYPRSPPRYSYNSRPNHYGGPGFRDEPPQPQPYPQPVYATQSYNTYKPSPSRYSSASRSDHNSGPRFRDEPSQPRTQTQPQPQPSPPPPQPVYATHSYNTYKPPPYVTGYAYVRSPPEHLPYSRPENNSGSGSRGEGEPSQPLYATNSHNIYKPSPYVSEYAYPESPPRYPSYSIPNNYSRDYYSGNHESGNVTSMFSEENPNACRIV